MYKELYAITDTRLCPRAKYLDYRTYIVPYSQKLLKHIDTNKPYYYTYYFSTAAKQDAFLENLIKNNKERKRNGNQSS